MAKAAYNSRSRLEDTRTDNIYNYSRKQDLGFSEIIVPNYAPDWTRNRQQLWAKTELANKRRDARTAKEILVALPRELDVNEQLSLVRKFVANNLTSLGVIADVNAHELDPSILPIDERESWNPHCHILISTQHLVDGEFGQKITSLNDRSFVIDLRKSWADLVNERLEAIGSSKRVDHRSNRARGIDRLPQIHLGHRVWSLKKKGIATDRGDRYEEIEERNREIETVNSLVSDAIQLAKTKVALNHIETVDQQTVSNLEEALDDEDDDLPLETATVIDKSVIEPNSTVERQPQSKTERLIELYYEREPEAVKEDVQIIKKLEKLGAKGKKSNSWLTIRLLDRNYTPEQTRQLLIHSEHTLELKFDEAARDINSNYQLALGVRQNGQKESSIDNSVNAKPVLESFCKDNLSTATVLFALAKRQLETSTLKEALLSIGLDFSYNSKSHVFTLYEEGMPFYEYISGYYKTNSLGLDSRIKIIKNDLPSSLNKEVMDVLFEFGFTASKVRRCPNWLKKITSKAEYGRKIPPSFLSLNRPESKFSGSVRLDELDQQTVAVYYRPYKRLFNSQGEEMFTFDIYRSPSLERQNRLNAWFKALGREPEWSIEEVVDNSLSEPEQLASVPTAFVTRQTTIEPQLNPKIEKQEQGEKLARIATEILARLKQTQFQFNHFQIQYDSIRGQIEIEDLLHHQTILVAYHEYNPDRWVVPERWQVNLDRTEITDNFVRHILESWEQQVANSIEPKNEDNDRQLIEDLNSYERLVGHKNKASVSNSWLVAKAIRFGYSPERIKRILAHTQHTFSLSPDKVQQSITDWYQLALTMKRSWKSLTFAEPEPSYEDPNEFDEYIEKIDISVTNIIIGLVYESSTASRLRNILAQFDLAIWYDAKMGAFAIYELGNPWQEYVCACVTDSGIKVKSDYLPKSLKQEIFEKLLKIEIPHWLPNYFDSIKFLKHRALRKGKNHYHPFALVSIAELRESNELMKSEIGRGFERALNEAASQELVASYSKPKSNISESSQCSIEPQIATPSDVINVSSPQPQKQPPPPKEKKNGNKIDAAELIRMGLERLPQYQLSRRKQQKLARRACSTVAKILNFLKVTQTEDERYKICYDPKISRIEIIDVACQKSVLTASYHQGSSVWVADLSNSNINEDVVKYLTNKLEALQKPKIAEDQSEQTSRFAQYKVTKDKSQNQSPKLNRQKKKGFEL